MAPVVYRHGDHAGNRGDVWKHAILSSVVRSVAAGGGPEATFRYFESHCGGPAHVLPEQGEWRDGIARVLGSEAVLAAFPYFAQFEAQDLAPGSLYPSSWVQVSRQLERLGRRYRLKLCDSSAEVAAQIQPGQCDFVRGDGFAELERDVEPYTLILIDPPYGSDHSADWRRVTALVEKLSAAGKCFLVWYPLYSSHTRRRMQELADATGSQCAEIIWSELDDAPGERMSGCGMLLGAEAREALDPSGSLTLLAEKLGARLARVAS